MIHPTKLKLIQQGMAHMTPSEVSKLLDDLDDIERTPPDKDWKKGEWRKQASTAFSPKGVQAGYQNQVDDRNKPSVKTKFSNWMNKTKNLLGGGKP